jgi:hypothetical protein
MRILANGRIGLGTTNPVALFDMGATATDRSICIWNNGVDIYGFGANESLFKYQAGTNGGHAWYTGSTPTSTGSQIMTLTSAGRLTTTGSVSTSNYMYVSDNGAFGRYIGNWAADNNWAIGSHDSSTGTTYKLRIGVSNGTGVWTGAYPAIFSGAYTNASDYRIKENITNLNYGLNEIKKIRPVLYNIKNDLNNKQIGFLAHEMQEIIPEIVSGDKDAVDENGKEVHQGINYANLTSVIIKGMQEHIDITDNLEEQIKLLIIENIQLKQQMTDIQKTLELLLQKN